MHNKLGNRTALLPIPNALGNHTETNMECFYHEEKLACGICKSCQRGICRECAVDVSNGIACKDRCETQAGELHAMISRSKILEGKSTAVINSVSLGSVELLHIVLGSLFLGYGIYESKNMIMYIGITFLLFGLVGVVRVIKAKRSGNP